MKTHRFGPLIIVLFFFFVGIDCFSQVGIGEDSIKVMSYNLTNYGNITTECTSANNGLTLKNPEFKTIIKYINPDILGVCEMNTNPAIATNFLANVLNTDGVTHFKRSNPQPEPSGTLTSVLFFNSEKLTLKFQSYANTSVRLVHHYRLYLNTESLATGDTVWINILACHLKAGTASTDVSTRASMATAVRNYLNSFPKKENCMILGDFNVYRSSEAAFQTLTSAGTNPTYQFLDPINRVGTWTANSTFADVHTQCPILSGNVCFSGGGLDDRFDFILMNRHLLFDSARLVYMPGTYKAIGNDGLHYNKSINTSPTNTSAPAAVINSLVKASDHLPVVARLKLTGTFVSNVEMRSINHSVVTYFQSNTLKLSGLESNRLEKILVFDMNGKIIYDGKGKPDGEEILVDFPGAKTGIYNLRLVFQDGKVLFSRAMNPGN